MRAIRILSCGLLLIAGCDAIDGDSSWGEERRSQWRIDDALCPGTEGGCDMEVPVASGVVASIDAEIPCAERERTSSGEWYSECDLLLIDVRAGGTADLRGVDYDTTGARIDLEVVTAGDGEAEIELLEADGSRFDRITFDVRQAVDMECGAVGETAAWDMPTLDRSASYTVSVSGADSVDDVELGCRLLDDRGLPLFSAAAISWRIVEGADLATVDDGGLFGGDFSTGARVYVRLDGRGTLRLRATFQALSRDVEIVVE